MIPEGLLRLTRLFRILIKRIVILLGNKGGVILGSIGQSDINQGVATGLQLAQPESPEIWEAVSALSNEALVGWCAVFHAARTQRENEAHLGVIAGVPRHIRERLQ